MGSTSVKLFTSTDPGAPVLTGAAGSLKSVLSACLVNGWGLQSVQSMTVAAGIATVTYATDHPFAVHCVALFSGATPVEINGEQRILSVVNGNTVTFAAPGVSDGAVTGSITSKRAPAGWTEMFAGAAANVLVVKPSVVEASGCVLYVDDTGTNAARVRGFESMSSITTGVGPFPTDAQQSGGGYFPKSNVAGATAIPWEIIADDQGFHYISAPYVSNNPAFQGRTGWWFGDCLPRKSGDAWACALLAGSSANSSAGTCYKSMNNGSENVFLARSHTGLGGSSRAGRFSHVLAPFTSSIDNSYSGVDAYCGDYPNAADNSLILSPVLVLEGAISSTATWRGTIPGVYHSPQKINQGIFSPNDIIDATDHLTGRKLLVSPARASSNAVSSQPGATFFDTTGPWR